MATGAGGSQSVGGAQFDITVPLSKFARALGQARSVAVKSVTRIGRSIVTIMGRAWRTVTAQMLRFTRVLRRLARTMMTVFLPLGVLGGGAAAGFGLYKVLAVFAEFEQKMARVHAVTGASEADFARLTEEAKRLGRTTAFSASQAAEAMGNFAVAGFEVKEIIAAMGPTLNLAAAGQLDMATASDIVAKTMKGMNLTSDQLTRAVDVMANAFTSSNTDLVMLGEAFKMVGPVGVAAGASIEQITASIMTMSDAGIQAGSAGTALRNLFLRMQAQPREVAKVFKKLGVEVADSSGKMKPMADIVDELNKAMKSYTPIQRNAMLMAIGGTRAAAALNTLMTAGGDALRDMEEGLKKEGTAAKIAERQLRTFKGAIQILKSSIEGAAISLGEKLAPSFGKVVKSLQPFVGTLGRLMGAIQPVVELWGVRMANAIGTADAFLKANMDTFERWGQRAAEILSNVSSAISDLLSWMGKLLGISGAGMLSGLVQTVDKIMDAMAVLTTNPMKTMGMLKDTIIAGFFFGVELLIKGLRNAFASYLAVVQGTIQFIGAYWQDILSIAWDGLKSVFDWFIKVGEAMFSWAATEIAAQITAALGFAADAWEQAASSARTTFAQAQGSPVAGAGDLAGRYGDALMRSQQGISGLIAKHLTGGVEADLNAKGTAAWKRVTDGWGEAAAEAAGNRPAELSPWEKMWRKVGMGLPGLAGDAKDAGLDFWARMEKGARKGKTGAGARPPGAEGSMVSKTTGLMQYLADIQSGIGKKAEDDVEKNTGATATNTGKGGTLDKAIGALPKAIGKEVKTGFA